MANGEHVAVVHALISASLVLSIVLPCVGAGEEQTLDSATDRSLFPKAYGVLANEKLMLPVDVSDWPVKIDATHQLFVDDYLIASTVNVKRTVHQASKHPGNPLMADHTPWEGRGPIFPIVRREHGKFRMWYAGNSRVTLPNGIGVRFPALYAESDDGIHWTRPELGLHECNGSKANNIVIPSGNLFGLHVDESEPDPKRRYKGIVWHEPEFVPREGYFLYTSPDGIHWSRERPEPLALSLSGYTMPQSGIGDTSIFRWDRRLGRYVGDVKFVLPGKMRTRGMMESDDLIHWTRPRMTIYPDALDDPDSQIYAHLSFCYESMWLGFLRVMHTERTKGYRQTTVELTASRDGRHWYRVGNREEVIPLGSEDEWDTDYHAPAWDPIPVGNELWIYYRGGKVRRNLTRRCDLGLAKIRRDGFVSLDAADELGSVLTRPLTFSGRRLFLNADIAPGGHVSVGVLSADKQPLAGYSLADATLIRDGGLAQPVAWKTENEIPLSRDAHLRLTFQLKNARLYSFWIE